MEIDDQLQSIFLPISFDFQRWPLLIKRNIRFAEAAVFFGLISARHCG
jgi:hypothetical protein